VTYRFGTIVNGSKFVEYKNTLNNFIIFLFTTVLGRAVTFLLLPIYSYRLTLDEFGQYELLLAVTAALVPFFTLCTHEAVLKNCMETEDSYIRTNNLFNSLFVLFLQSVILSAVIFIFFSIFEINEFLPLLYVISFAVLSSMFEILSKYAKANAKNKVFSVSSILLAIGMACSTYVGVYIYDGGLVFVLNSYLIGYALAVLYILFALKIPKNFFNHKISFDLELLRGMMLIGLPLIPNALMWWVMNLSDRWFISYFLGLSDVGLYSVANKVSSLIIVFNGILFQTWQVYLYGKKKALASGSSMYSAFILYGAILGIACLFLIVVNRELLHFILSDEYAAAWYIGNVLILSSFLFGLSSALGVFYVIESKTAFALKSSASAATLNVILNIALIPWLGLLGAAYSTVLSSALMFLLRRFDKVGTKYVRTGFFEWLVILIVFTSIATMHVMLDSTVSVVLFALSLVLFIYYFIKLYKKRYI